MTGRCPNTNYCAVFFLSINWDIMPCQISILCFWTHIQKIGTLFLGTQNHSKILVFQVSISFWAKNQQFILHFWLDFLLFSNTLFWRKKFKVQKAGETGSEPISSVVLSQSKWRGAPRISSSVFLSFLFGILNKFLPILTKLTSHSSFIGFYQYSPFVKKSG